MSERHMSPEPSDRRRHPSPVSAWILGSGSEDDEAGGSSPPHPFSTYFVQIELISV